jgi:hypothetical protein
MSEIFEETKFEEHISNLQYSIEEGYLITVEMHDPLNGLATRTGFCVELFNSGLVLLCFDASGTNLTTVRLSLSLNDVIATVTPAIISSPELQKQMYEWYDSFIKAHTNAQQPEQIIVETAGQELNKELENKKDNWYNYIKSYIHFRIDLFKDWWSFRRNEK